MVLTRWNCWYKVVEYLSEFIFHIKKFLNTEQDQQDKSELIDSLLLILNEPIQFTEVRLVLQFMYERAKIFSELIEFFETPKGTILDSVYTPSLAKKLQKYLKIILIQIIEKQSSKNFIEKHGKS